MLEKTGVAIDIVPGCDARRGTTLPRLTSNANGTRNLSEALSQTQYRTFGEFVRSANASNAARSAKHDDCHRWLTMNEVVICSQYSLIGRLPLNMADDH